MIQKDMIYKGIRAADPLPSGIPQEEREQAVLSRIIEAILAANEIQIPQAQEEEAADRKMLEYRHRLQYESMCFGIPYDKMKEDTEKLLKQFRKEARLELQTEQILQTVIAGEGLMVSPEELEAEAAAMAERQNLPLEMVKGFFGEDYGMLRQELLEKRAMKFLYENAVSG